MIIKGEKKVENYIDFQDVEPKNPVKGQKYYDGDKVVTWTGSEWKTVVNPTKLEKDVASAVQAGESAGEKADEAKSESSKAVESANSAVNKANSAVDDAGFAKNTANEAKSTADKANEQADEAKSNASQAIEDAKSSLEKSDSNEQTIINVSKSLDTVKGELSSKVNQTDYAKLKGTVSDQSTSIEQNAKDIKLKASSQDVNTINETVKNHGTEISQNAKAIKTKAEQSDVDNVSGEVETLSTTVSQEAGKLSTVSSKVSDNESLIGKLESSYDGLNSTVAKVRNDFDELDINDRNLLLNSANLKDRWHNYKNSNFYIEKIDMSEEWGTKDAYKITVSGGEHQIKALFTTSKNMSEPMLFDTLYTYSVYIKNTGDTDINFHINGLRNNKTSLSPRVKPGENTRLVFTGSRRENYDWFQAMLRVFPEDEGKKIQCTIALEKIQKGNRATDWSPAPENMATVEQFSSLEQNLNGFKTTVQNEKADKTTVTQLSDQWQQTTELVDGHTSQISSLGSDLNLRVEKDNIIKQINLSDEGILIDGGKTHITGKTTIDEGVIDTAHIKNAAITSAKIKSITAGKIEAGTVKGLVLSSESATGKFSVEGQHAIFENTDTKDRLELDSEGFVGYRPDGTKSIQFNEYMATTAKFGTSFTNAYITTGGTDGAEGEIKNGEARVVKYHSDMADSDTGGAPSNYIYSPIRAQGFTGGFLDLNTAIPGKENIYLRTDGGEVRVTKIGTTDDYQNIRAQYFYGNVLENNGLVGGDSVYLRPAAGSRVRVTAKGTTDNWQNLEAQDIYVRQIKQQGSDRDDMFIGLNGVLRITSRSTYNNSNGVYYRGVAASRFVTMSRGDKASIASLASTMTSDEGGLDCIVKSADGETPESIQDPESGGVDLQKMSDVAWNAIRELNKKVKDLRSENEILRKELNNE